MFAKRRHVNPAITTKSALHAALARRDHEHALELIARLEELEPADPRWPHKCGDLLRMQQRPHEAAEAYRRAAERYADQGFEDRSRAIRRLARQLAGQSAQLVPPHRSIRP